MLTYPHQQITNTTQENPLIIPNYPMYFGAYCPHAFWHTTSGANNHKEVIHSASWNEQTNKWNIPKVRTEPKTTIALLHLNSNPQDTQKGLPIITSIRIDKDIDPNALYHFCINPYHHFDNKQKDILAPVFLKYFHSGTEQYQQLEALWHYFSNRTIDTSHKKVY